MSSEVVAIDSSSGSISSPSGRTGAATTSPLPCEEEEMTKGVVDEWSLTSIYSRLYG